MKSSANEAARAEAFEAFLAEQAKERPNEVLRLDDDAAGRDVVAIPTGALSLDVALGCGGFPRGRIIELFGPEMSGKCLQSDTLVWTERGLETIEEVFNSFGQEASNATRVTDISAAGFRMVNEEGELELVEALTHNGARATKTIRLASGRSITATHNHPLRVINDRGYIVWKRVGDMSVGDVVVSAAFGAQESNGTGDLSEDEAILLGYLVAEGTMGGTTKTGFTNFDNEVAAEFISRAESILGAKVVSYQEGNYWINSKEIRTHLLEHYGMEVVKSAGKTIPYKVRTAGPATQAAFLSALYEGDGWIEDGPSIGLTSASEELAKQLQLMLLGLGIPAGFAVKHNKTYERNYFNILIGPGAVHRFLDIVGFRTARRAAQVTAHIKDTCRVSNSENIPNLGTLIRDLRDMVGGDRAFDRLYGDLRRDGHTDCSRDRLSKIISWARTKTLSAAATRVVSHLEELRDSHYTYERIVDITDAGEQPTFDVVLPRTHSFIANGIVSHNTSLALSVASRCQDLGGKVGFVDAEHALNRQHAIDMGVNPHDMVIYQPSSGEDAMDMTKKMVDSGGFDMVIVDSVAAMTPQAEIDAEVGAQQMGLHARLMSKFMRLLVEPVSKTDTMLVLINQIRSNLGAYGAPEVSTGGRAIKFYSSVRIEVRSAASKKIERNKVVVGQTCVATVRKNKAGPPHRVAEYDLIFGEGIEAGGSLLEVCENLGIITRGGSSYTDATTGERIGVGKENVKALLTEDEALATRLTEAVYAALAPKDTMDQDVVDSSDEVETDVDSTE